MNVRIAAVSISAFMSVAGCNEQPPGKGTVLRTDSASCVPEAYLLELPEAGRYVLNAEIRDSLGVVHWLANVLPKRSGDGRVVNVRGALPDRRSDLDWIVPAVQKAGGKPYAFDPACHIEIPTRAG